jgi:hypothetical protein
MLAIEPIAYARQIEAQIADGIDADRYQKRGYSRLLE